MLINTSLHRWTIATLLVATSAVTFAPMALADPGWRRFKHEDRGSWRGPMNDSWRGPRGRVVVMREREHVGAGPVFAGLLGGMILGAVLQSHAQPVVVHEHRYDAPSCERDRVYAPRRVYVPEHVYAPERVYSPEPEHVYAPQAPAPVYRYEDGNGERWWDTLDECTEAARGRSGPRVIKVVDDGTNEVVQTLYWKYDHWIDGSDD